MMIQRDCLINRLHCDCECTASFLVERDERRCAYARCLGHCEQLAVEREIGLPLRVERVVCDTLVGLHRQLLIAAECDFEDLSVVVSPDMLATLLFRAGHNHRSQGRPAQVVQYCLYPSERFHLRQGFGRKAVDTAVDRRRQNEAPSSRH
ncbi:hypothetical protein VSR69_43265 [Paraburkholderia phytofirmans]